MVPVAAAGFLMKKEMDYLGLATENPPAKYLLSWAAPRSATRSRC